MILVRLTLWSLGGLGVVFGWVALGVVLGGFLFTWLFVTLYVACDASKGSCLPLEVVASSLALDAFGVGLWPPVSKIRSF